MPVVIKEMRVKVTVEEPKREREPALQPQNGSDNRDVIIDACVEKVLEVLEHKKKR
ncbi:MAG: DUF5908 family protein [Balneolaceae bacterium]|nr:DUF5908 family protein [Balneolaceae bacterium]